MIIKALVDEDFVNFKKCSMFIGFPTCTWKCGKGLCQNTTLATCQGQEIKVSDLVERYINNPLSEAIVCGGLEPMDSFDELVELISTLRIKGNFDNVVIYTGYNKEEIIEQIEVLQVFQNIIVKFGRYIPNDTPHFDEVLGVTLQSKNQYAEVI